MNGTYRARSSLPAGEGLALTGCEAEGFARDQSRGNGTRKWIIATDAGFSVSGYLPLWAEADPSECQVPMDRLGIALSDINHHQDIGGRLLPLPLRAPGERDVPGQDHRSVPVFCGSIDCDPYAPEPERRVPVFNFHLVDDYRVEALGPDDVAELAAVFRAQADVLDNHVRPALISAREDWATRPD